MKTAAKKGAAGVDYVTVKGYSKQLEANLSRVREQLASGTYYRSRIRRTYIPKSSGGELRPHGIPTVQDRIVQTAIRHMIEPIFEQTSFRQPEEEITGKAGCGKTARPV